MIILLLPCGITYLHTFKNNYILGMEFHAQCTVFGEGCRGQLSKSLMKHFKLVEGKEKQIYGLGMKELWQVRPEVHNPGCVEHTVGWPLPDYNTYGGSFLYHLAGEDNLVAVGFVVGLDYKNPHLHPFKTFQQFKNHPSVRPTFEGKILAIAYLFFGVILFLNAIVLSCIFIRWHPYWIWRKSIE